jgi:hypothetical protein
MQANDSMVAWSRRPPGRRGSNRGRDPWSANAWGGFSRGGTALVALGVLAVWGAEGWQRFVRMGALDPEIAAPLPGTAVTLAVRVAMVVVEALFYVVVWAAAGRRLRFLAFATAVLLASSLDLSAIALRDWAPGAGALARVVIGGLAGPRGLEPPATGIAPPDGPFATLGVLTLGRIALTAWAQAHGLRRGLLVPLLVTVASWLAFHVGLAWYSDFARGVAHGGTP